MNFRVSPSESKFTLYETLAWQELWGSEVFPLLQTKSLSLWINEGRKHDTLGSEIKENLLFTTLAVPEYQHFLVPVPWVPIPTRCCRGPSDTWTCSELLITRNPEFREPKHFLMGCKHAWPLMQQEIVSTFQVCANILEKLVWNKGNQCLSYKTCRSLKDLWRIFPQQYHRKYFALNTFIQAFGGWVSTDATSF